LLRDYFRFDLVLALPLALAFGFAFLPDLQPHVLHIVSPFQKAVKLFFLPAAGTGPATLY
jgi:hypothetical protein